MYRKGAQDAKRARQFAKLSREIFVAARSGLPDPHVNPRLRAALSAARAVNMPKDNMERALKKATTEPDSVNFEDVRYEGYGSGGIPIIVEALTDNRNRTASDVRSLFNKFGGSLGETGSVSFQFEHLGLILFDKNSISLDRLFEAALEAGADNVEEQDHFLAVTCSVEDFAHVRDELMKRVGDPLEAKLFWRPHNPVPANESTEKLIDALEDLEDVQNVYASVGHD